MDIFNFFFFLSAHLSHAVVAKLASGVYNELIIGTRRTENRVVIIINQSLCLL